MPLLDYVPRPAHLKWLLDSDPAIRWQVLRDLTDEAPNAIAAERSRVATEGWGSQLLALQSPPGNWGGPKEDRGLLITLCSLVVLMDLGLDPASKQARKMIDRVDRRLVFKPLNNRPFLHGETEPCINGRILALGEYFKKPSEALAKQLMRQQLEDGGWNCEAVEPSAKRPLSRRSSFHTTICVLEGLLAYERAGRKSAAVTKARKKGEEYLLERRMFRSLRTGEVIDERWLRFSYPTFWHYDVLRGLDYLQNAGVKPDSRVREAIEIVIKRRHQNGRWPLNLLHAERIPVEIETAVGRASAGTHCGPSEFCVGTTTQCHRRKRAQCCDELDQATPANPLGDDDGRTGTHRNFQFLVCQPYRVLRGFSAPRTSAESTATLLGAVARTAREREWDRIAHLMLDSSATRC